MSEQPSQSEQNAGIYDYDLPDPPSGEQRKSKSKDRRSNFQFDDGRAIGGLILISLGLVFLLDGLGVLVDFQWWALFLIVPGMVMLFKAWTRYMQSGEVPDDLRGEAFGGLFMVVLGMIFLFSLDFGKIWPIFLILPGLGLLFGWIGDDDDDESDDE
jgi:hypothetical protein